MIRCSFGLTVRCVIGFQACHSLRRRVGWLKGGLDVCQALPLLLINKLVPFCLAQSSIIVESFVQMSLEYTNVSDVALIYFFKPLFICLLLLLLLLSLLFRGRGNGFFGPGEKSSDFVIRYIQRTFHSFSVEK